MKYINNYTEDTMPLGVPITVTIDGLEGIRGIIQKVGNYFYILQNRRKGQEHKSLERFKKDYVYSWAFRVSSSGLYSSHVSNIKRAKNNKYYDLY